VWADVDDLKFGHGSGLAELDKSCCILAFCTSQYFEKFNSLRELYRTVAQSRPILAMLEPDKAQEGGLDQKAIEALITSDTLHHFGLSHLWGDWASWKDCPLLPNAMDHAPDETEVCKALFAKAPVEWNRLPHFQVRPTPLQPRARLPL
jgi:hypothetical protein